MIVFHFCSFLQHYRLHKLLMDDDDDDDENGEKLSFHRLITASRNGPVDFEHGHQVC